MRRNTLLTVLTTLILLMLAPVVALSDELPPGPTVVYRSQFPVTNPPAQFDVINLVLDFAPGAWTPVHTHGGHGMVTVLEGEITHRPQGREEQKLKPGQSFFETPGSAHTAGNGDSAKARVVFTDLLPKGVPLTTVQGAASGQDLPPGPTTVYRSTLDVTNPPTQFDVINLVLDFAPGAWTPMHTHGGHGIVTVLEGEITHRPQGQVEQKLKPGQSFFETPGSLHAAGNATDQKARVLFTVLLPTDAALTTVQPAAPATLPTTGGVDPRRYATFLLLIGSSLVAVGAWRARRQTRPYNPYS